MQINLGQLLYAWNGQYKNDENINFFGHCISNFNRSTSQNFQDIWALFENNFKRDGFFVEFGATDGVEGSNSFLLESSYNWNGILAEPNTVWHNKLVKNRKCQIVFDCVYTETGKELEFVNTNDPTLSTINGYGMDDEHQHKRMNGAILKVKTVSLNDLLKNAPNCIDYLSIDTEGSEYEILNSYFQNKNNKQIIKCITVEHNFNNDLRSKIRNLLFSNGYKNKFEWMSRWDDFFVLNEI